MNHCLLEPFELAQHGTRVHSEHSGMLGIWRGIEAGRHESKLQVKSSLFPPPKEKTSTSFKV
jgi:hypothetical protein